MKQPMERYLDGIYIQVEVNGALEGRCLTDCTWDQVEQWLRTKATVPTQGEDRAAIEYLVAVIKHLHGSLRDYGDHHNKYGRGTEFDDDGCPRPKPGERLAPGALN